MDRIKDESNQMALIPYSYGLVKIKFIESEKSVDQFDYRKDDIVTIWRMLNKTVVVWR